jgi:hypothetical protein
MERQILLNKIVYYASTFVQQLKSHGSMGYTDMNIHAENAFIPILNIVFDVELINKNSSKKNFPAIDLADDNNRIAFQVTATPTEDRVIDTLKKFIDNGLYNQYYTLYIFILGEKQNRYNRVQIKKLLQGKINFDVNTHIIDSRDLLNRIDYKPIEKLRILETLYQQLAELPVAKSTMVIPRQIDNSEYRGPEENSFIHRIKSELRIDVGDENISKIPELPELFQKIADLNDQIQQKAEELENCKKEMEKFRHEGSLQAVLTRAYNSASNEYENLLQIIEQHKAAVTVLAQKIRRQKEFLDQIDYQHASERMKEAKRLFEAGEYSLAAEKLDYEGREAYMEKKLEEKERQADEWTSLANEEAFLALSMMLDPDWENNVQKIRAHFDMSIKFGGYLQNAYHYSFFLAAINEEEKALDVLNKTILYLPGDELVNRALVLERLGNLLESKNKEDALKAYTEAADIYEVLFERDPEAFTIDLANVSYQCGALLMHISLNEARVYLERALLVMGSRQKPGTRYTLKLSYSICVALGYWHLVKGDFKQSCAYHRLVLELGGMLVMNDPDNLHHLLEAVDKYRTLFREEKEGAHTALFYGIALRYYLKFHNELPAEESYKNAKALIDLGEYLLTAQEVTGANICFQNALKIFRKLNDNGFSCPYDIADSLRWVGFKYRVNNKVKSYKKVLLEALSICREHTKEYDARWLSMAASILDELYMNSFIAVSPSLYYRADPYFQEAINIYKLLDSTCQEPDFRGWVQLLQHQSTFILMGLDKTDAINCFQELIFLKSRIPAQQLSTYEESIQVAIHRLGEPLFKNVNTADPLFHQITHEIIDARTMLYNKDPDEYRFYLFNAVYKTGDNFFNSNQWNEAHPYLYKAVELIRELESRDQKAFENMVVRPTFSLAVTCERIKDFSGAATHYISLCAYFESKLHEHPEYLTLLVSMILAATEVLFLNGQKDKASTYIAKALTYLSSIPEPSEQTRLDNSFKELIKEYG